MRHNHCDSAAWGRKLLTLCTVVLSASLAFAGSRKLSRELESATPGSRIDVIVQYKQVPTEAHYQRMKGKGGLEKARLHNIKAAAFSLPASALKDLDADPDVAYVSPDRPVSSTASTTDFYDTAVNASYGWGLGYDGTGIGVAVIDSGINSSAMKDLNKWASNSKRVVYSQSFVPGDTSTSDAYGHGTHLAGIVAGNGWNSAGSSSTVTFQGIAKNASLINLRVLNQFGVGTDSAVIAAIQQAISLKNTYNIKVINLSLGRPVYESYTQDPLCQAVESAWRAGIVVVVAAGNMGRDNSFNNGGYGTINAPGNDPYVITVGAMKPMGTGDRADDLIATYSSKGPTLFDHVVKPDLVAPGNLAISVLPSSSAMLFSSLTSVPTQYYNSGGSSAASSQYFKLSGTSMATPVVSGAAALMFQQNASLTPDQVKARLMKTAYKTFPKSSSWTDPVTGITYTDQYDIFTIGAGYVDIQAALSNADLAPATAGSALSPTVTKDASGNIVLVNGSSVIWGGSVLWGTSVVWGNSVLWGTNVSGQSVLWGSGVVWGTSAMQGYSVLWGNSVVWGTSSTPTGEAIAIAINGEN